MRFFASVTFAMLALGSAASESPGNPVVLKVTSIESPSTVLFVGNSFSYFNDGLHDHVTNLVRAAGRFEEGKTRLRLTTISGA